MQVGMAVLVVLPSQMPLRQPWLGLGSLSFQVSQKADFQEKGAVGESPAWALKSPASGSARQNLGIFGKT